MKESKKLTKKELNNIIIQIGELKEKPQSKDVKIKIQKLQQLLNIE